MRCEICEQEAELSKIGRFTICRDCNRNVEAQTAQEVLGGKIPAAVQASWDRQWELNKIVESEDQEDAAPSSDTYALTSPTVKAEVPKPSPTPNKPRGKRTSNLARQTAPQKTTSKVGSYPDFLNKIFVGLPFQIVGLGLFALFCFLMIDADPNAMGPKLLRTAVAMFAVSFLFTGLIMFVIGCCEWAKSKGHPSYLGWLGWLGLPGLIILYLLLQGVPSEAEAGEGYFCQVCGHQPAHTPGTRAYTVCSKACAEEFEKMYMAVAFQGKLVIGAPDGLMERMGSPRTWKYCKHCGEKMEMQEKTCDTCGGSHSM
jgi:hypothetical protein